MVEQARRICHRRVKPQAVERVAEIVVCFDVLLRATLVIVSKQVPGPHGAASSHPEAPGPVKGLPIAQVERKDPLWCRAVPLPIDVALAKADR